MENSSLFKTLVMTFCVGLFSGLMGSFVVLKRMSQLQDVLGHAVFPGILVGFIVWGSKDHPGLVGTACASVLFALLVIRLIRALHRKFPERLLAADSAQGAVLVGVFCSSMALFSFIERSEGYGSSKAGLKDFLFGQLAAISVNQTLVLFFIMFCFFVYVGTLYRAWAFVAFDPVNARVMGLPVKWIETLFFVFQALYMTAALQAAGLVLVAGFLVIPAAIALLLTKSVESYIVMSALIGGLGTLGGAFISFKIPGVPTGPTAVLVMFVALLGTLIFTRLRLWRRVGIRAIRGRAGEREMQLENVLKSAYILLERGQFQSDRIGLKEFAAFRNTTLKDARRQLLRVCDEGLAFQVPGDEAFQLTGEGWAKAYKTIRAHRLWEIYQSKKMGLPPEVVHVDAEFTEHQLSPQEIAQVESELDYPKWDPHGKPIPGVWSRLSKGVWRSGK
jgi:manganese/zinc/iron transport system permease protein